MYSMLIAAVGLIAGTTFSAEIPKSVTITIPQGSHPCVFMTQQEVEAMRGKADSQEWAGKLRANVIETANNLIAEELDIPHEGGQWNHWYTCKEDGGSLKAESPTRHVCETCGKVYSGYPYDKVYITRRHSHWLGGISSLGLAYALDPKPEYAARIREILLEYASFYSSLPLHDVNNKPNVGGRLKAQTLDEAVTFCQVMQGYDLAYDAPCFSQEDHEKIRDGLLLPVVKTIQANPRAVSNWQSWHNAAVGCIGLVIGDKSLVDWAINGTSGFLFQMGHSLTPSGMWFEECPSYHFYALRAHVFLIQAAARAGIDLAGIPVVKSMFDAPLRQVLPDKTFAPLHDSDRFSLLDEGSYYDIAYSLYHDPKYIPIIGDRSGDWALMWGVDCLPKTSDEMTVAKSTNADGEGLAILRDPKNEIAAYLDYGPGKSGHVQPAKLGLVLYAFGDIRFADPGRIAYGNPLHKEWFRQTVAHNTMVVNGESQKIAPGLLKGFASGEGYGFCRAMCEKAYGDDVLLDRSIFLNGHAITDVFQCSAKDSSTFDLPIHFVGAIKNPPPCESIDSLGDSNGYQHLKNVRRCLGNVKEISIDVGNENTVLIRFLEEAETFLAEGHAAEMKGEWPIVIRRLKGKEAKFAAVYQILKQGESPVTVNGKIGKKVCVKTGDAKLVVSNSDSSIKIAGKRCKIDEVK